MVGIRTFVDEGLGHSSYLVDLGDGTAASSTRPASRPPPAAARASGWRRGLDDRHALPRRLRDRQPGTGLGRRHRVHRSCGVQAGEPHLPCTTRNGSRSPGVALRAIATPGHTPDHHVYLLEQAGAPPRCSPVAR